MIFKILFSLVPVLDPAQLGRENRLGRFLKRSVALCLLVRWLVATITSRLLPPFRFPQFAEKLQNYAPPHVASHHRQPFTYGEMSVVWWLAPPPVGGLGGGRFATLADALKLGADCPQTPTAGKRKTAEKAVFLFPARILKPKFL